MLRYVDEFAGLSVSLSRHREIGNWRSLSRPVGTMSDDIFYKSRSYRLANVSP